MVITILSNIWSQDINLTPCSKARERSHIVNKHHRKVVVRDGGHERSLIQNVIQSLINIHLYVDSVYIQRFLFLINRVA